MPSGVANCSGEGVMASAASCIGMAEAKHDNANKTAAICLKHVS